MIGEQVFCVRITADPPLLDWRYDYGRLSYTIETLPERHAGLLRGFLRRFGLAPGCFDLAVRTSGELVFLECNPNGQWAWIEEHTGLEMAAAFAGLLEKGCR